MPTTKSSQPEPSVSSQDRILETAIEEFSRKGFAATRVDTLAERAGANKQLIYYYFGSKARLFDAAIGRMVETFEFSRTLHDVADFEEYFDALAGAALTPDSAVWRRLLAWEGIEYGTADGDEVRREADRTANYRALLEVIEGALADGTLPSSVDSQGLALLLIYASVLPDALPQITRMITHLEADNPKLWQRIRETLRGLVLDAGQEDQSR